LVVWVFLIVCGVSVILVFFVCLSGFGRLGDFGSFCFCVLGFFGLFWLFGCFWLFGWF
jgi:hypothetical protein